MGLDIVEIGLSSITDARAFEKLASEIMRGEGYHDIRPLGGVSDQGQDAVQDRFYEREGRVRTVFQYTLEDYIARKLRDTVKVLTEKKIEFSELIIVTPVKLSSERQLALERLGRQGFNISLKIYERETLANRLSDLSNNIFYRYFPNIEKQLDILNIGRPMLADRNEKLEMAMLKVSIACVFGDQARSVRQSLFDHLVLACLVEQKGTGLTPSDVAQKLANSLTCEVFPASQVEAALVRLRTLDYVTVENHVYRLTDRAAAKIGGVLVEIDSRTSALISDVVEKVCNNAPSHFSEEERNRFGRNAKDILAELFRLLGVELASQFDEKGIPAPLFLESSDRILALASRQTSKEGGELLVAALADLIQHPSDEQAQVLACWARAFIGAAVMNLDPVLRQVQSTFLRDKMFILDTDFLMDCLIRELPINGVFLALVRGLLASGCRVIVPEAVIKECADHISHAVSTYTYFGRTIMALTPAIVDRKVNNAVVAGYYYAIKDGRISSTFSFKDYWQNYYAPEAPLEFVRRLVADRFPSGVDVKNPEDMVEGELPSDLVEKVSEELAVLAAQSPKSQYRTQDDERSLANIDARLFIAALRLNAEGPYRPTRSILGGSCYLITRSNRYLRTAKRLAIRDVVSTRPQQLIGLLEIVSGPKVDDVAFVRLFENPMLNYAVDQVWDDPKALVANGVALSGKSLVRLKWDLDKLLHTRIAALEQADGRAEAQGDQSLDQAADIEYVELIQEAVSLGYAPHPSLEPLQRALAQARADVSARKAAVAQLEKKYGDLASEIARFGKRKQRYLRRVMKTDNVRAPGQRDGQGEDTGDR